MASMLKKTEGIEQSRRRQRFNAHSASYTSSNSQRIRIDINSSEEYLDFANSYLVFELSVAGATTDVGLPRFTASSWIKEVRVKDRAGNMIGENMQDYNVLARVLFESNVNLEAEKSYLDATEGAMGITVANGTTIASRQYAHQFVSGVFANKNYFPAHTLGGVQIELDMANADDVVLESGSAATYTISNLAMVCDMVKLKPEVESMVLNQIQQGGLVVDYNTHHCVKGTITGTTNNVRFDLGTMNGRVKSLQAIQVAAAASDVDTNNFWVKNNLSNYRFRLGSKNLSESQIECGAGKQAEYVNEWLKSQKALCLKDMLQFGSQTNELAVLQGTSASRKFFIIGQGVDRSQSDSVLSSLKDKDHNKLELELNYSSQPAASTLYVFAELDKRMVIYPGKQHNDDDFSGQGTNMQ